MNKEKEMSIRKAMNSAFQGNLVEMQDEFRASLNQRAVNALDEKKIEIAQTSYIKD